MKGNKIICLKNGFLIDETRSARLIDFEEIIFLASDSPYVCVHLLGGEKYFFHTSMSKIAKLLPECFLLCNQACIVNLNYATCLNNEKSKCTLELTTGVVIPVPRRKIKLVKERFIFSKTSLAVAEENQI